MQAGTRHIGLTVDAQYVALLQDRACLPALCHYCRGAGLPTLLIYISSVDGRMLNDRLLAAQWLLLRRLGLTHTALKLVPCPPRIGVDFFVIEAPYKKTLFYESYPRSLLQFAVG